MSNLYTVPMSITNNVFASVFKKNTATAIKMWNNIFNFKFENNFF